jgi:AraC-like DNA-binding protein
VARLRTERRRKALLVAAQQAIRERYAEFDLELADIAADVGCSPRHLQRVFAESGGESFREHLLRVRMENAHRLLSRRKHGLTVRATASLVGYRKPSGLRQAFLRFYGESPSEVQSPPPDYDEFWRAAEQRSRNAP